MGFGFLFSLLKIHKMIIRYRRVQTVKYLKRRLLYGGRVVGAQVVEGKALPLPPTPSAADLLCCEQGNYCIVLVFTNLLQFYLAYSFCPLFHTHTSSLLSKRREIRKERATKEGITDCFARRDHPTNTRLSVPAQNALSPSHIFQHNDTLRC